MRMSFVSPFLFISINTFVSFCYGFQSCDNLPEVQVKVIRSTEGDGFDRVIKTNFTVWEPSSGNNIQRQFLIKEYFPNSMYVDPFQNVLRDPDSTFQIYFPKAIDIEKSADVSDPQLVYIFHNTCEYDSDEVRTVWECSYRLPFRLRYQKAEYPLNGSNYVEVLLPVPDIFVNYEGSKKHSSLKGCNNYLWNDVGDPTGDTKLLWLKLKMNSEKSYETSLKFRVPRGNLLHTNFIACITVVVLVSSFIYLALFILYTKRKTHKNE